MKLMRSFLFSSGFELPPWQPGFVAAGRLCASGWLMQPQVLAFWQQSFRGNVNQSASCPRHFDDRLSTWCHGEGLGNEMDDGGVEQLVDVASEVSWEVAGLERGAHL